MDMFRVLVISVCLCRFYIWEGGGEECWRKMYLGEYWGWGDMFWNEYSEI